MSTNPPDYQAKYMRRWRRKRRAAAVAALGGVCVKCGTTKRLEFHHKNPAAKLDRIGRLLSANARVFWAEVRKCELLCYEHHLDRTLEVRNGNSQE